MSPSSARIRCSINLVCGGCGEAANSPVLVSLNWLAKLLLPVSRVWDWSRIRSKCKRYRTVVRRTSALLFLLLVLPLVHGQKTKEPDWRPPLAEGGVPECPDHAGARTLYSETITNGSTKAWIAGTAVRVNRNKCNYKADLVLSGAENRSIALPHPENREFDIADFSPDGKRLLLDSDGGQDDFRMCTLRSLPLAVAA